MKYSNTAITQLTRWYKQILIKCAIFNAAILLGGAVIASPAMAERSGGVNVETATGVEWQNGSGVANGGAEFTEEGHATTITNSKIHNNTASNVGGALVNLGTMSVGGELNNNTAGTWGGAIYNAGNLTISDDTTFENNKSGSVGGAIANALGTSMITVGSNVSFEGNEAVNDGGAIGNYKGAALVNGTTFTANKAQTGTEDVNAIGGGAMSLGAESQTQISGATFTDNTSGFNGGAIGTRNAWSADNSAAKLDVINSTFTGNKANGGVESTFKDGAIVSTGGNGGAIDNHFFFFINEENSAYVANSTFTNNKAINGGAIYNNGVADSAGKKAAMTIAGSTFTGNTATEQGGAIYNAGEITFTGTNTFSGNTANDVANDIYNTGTLNINGTATLAGGIDGDSANKGTVNVAGDVEVSTIKNQTVAHNSGELHITNGAADGSRLLSAHRNRHVSGTQEHPPALQDARTGNRWGSQSHGRIQA